MQLFLLRLFLALAVFALGLSAGAAPTNSAPDAETVALREVMAQDDDAQSDVARWIREFDALPGSAKTIQASDSLNKRIAERFAPVRKSYERFLRNHPESARGFLAFGSFLNDTGDAESARSQFENARQVDPKNPAAWNNLANYYVEHGPVTNAFAHYAEAIRLKPDEGLYARNLANTISVFRKEARDFFRLDEQQLSEKALGLYRQALKRTPENFVLATDYANCFYGIRPLRTNDALAAWTNALSLARSDVEREGVQIHLARVKLAAGLPAEALKHLAAVTNAAFADLKTAIEQVAAGRSRPATNSAPAISTNAPPAPVDSMK